MEMTDNTREGRTGRHVDDATESPRDELAYANTYTYLRIAIVCLLIGLAVAAFYQAWQQQFQFLPSVSAYYYTPAQAIFVGALVSLGACTIALKGTSTLEDVLLNLAGMLAAVVAIVPTSRGNDFDEAVRACRDGSTQRLTEQTSTDLNCPTVQALVDATRANVENNMIALLIAGLLGFVASAFLARSDKTRDHADKFGRSERWWGFVVAALIFVAAATTFLLATEWFIDRAHYIAAIGLFACIVLVAITNAVRRDDKEPTLTREGLKDCRDALLRPPKRIDRYAWIAWAMVGVAVLGTLLFALDAISLFLLEILVALLFAVLWTVQTIDQRPGRATPAGPEPAPATPDFASHAPETT